MPATPKEVFATNVVSCDGRVGEIIGNDRMFDAALNSPVQALVTTYKDATRNVCCPFLNGVNCTAGMPIDKDSNQFAPSCAYSSY